MLTNPCEDYEACIQIGFTRLVELLALDMDVWENNIVIAKRNTAKIAEQTRQMMDRQARELADLLDESRLLRP